MSLSSELNPFQPPSMRVADSLEYHEPIFFSGSMSEAEGAQVSQLIKGQKTTNVDPKQLVWIGACSLMVIGYFAAEIIVSDQFDQLLEVGLGVIAVIGTLAAVAYQQKVARGVTARLKQDRRGVFTNLTGQVTEQGVEYRIGDYPIRYSWNDFVGCRCGDDAVVLYLSYPKEVNFFAASLFEGPEQWKVAKECVRAKVPVLTQFPKLQARGTSPRIRHITAGIQSLDQLNWQQALREFDGALQLQPGDTQALHGRMVAAVGSQDLEISLAAIEDVVALGSPDATTRRMRAAVMINLDRFEEALDDLDWLIEKSAEDSDLLRDRGLALYKLGRHDEALRDCSAAISLNPKDHVAYNNRGALFLSLGNHEQAIADLETAIRIEPSFERPKELLAEATRAVTL